MNINKVCPTAIYCNNSLCQLSPVAKTLNNINLQFIIKKKCCLTWNVVGVISKDYQNIGLYLTLKNGNVFNIVPDNINQLIRTLKHICNFSEGKYKMILIHTNIKKKKVYRFNDLYQTIHWCLELINDCKNVKIMT